ncbi:MAG TPA: YdeI/OmpD-associated family protein, partial [Acidobacteriaceae bacterium]|nr:YdeI/OmpD-associated family protein [Acidobacteriaceae bacterium]
EVNGFLFRTSLFPAAGREGEFFLLVNRTMQAGAGLSLGDMAEFVLEPDLEEREAELPDELAVLLDEEEGLRAFYDSMTEYARREIGKWIAGVKSEDARLRRVEQMAERLLLTMEGERELPPVVEAAFRLRPKARAGWKKMTATQKRHELFAVFYYRTPESQAKRVQGLCDVAEKKA